MAKRGKRRQPGRPINGLVLLDKPSGMTSNAALQEVKRLFFARKAGHTGSLDPLASGMLPICFGEATKLSGYLLDADKTYEMTGLFGVATDSGDADGEIIETQEISMPEAAAIEAAIEQFLGDIEQIPPMYSAVRVNGKRLYELARAGETIEREPRPVHIYEFKLLSISDNSASFRVRCSKGTYVRTLVEDLAKALGTVAHVTVLRRLAVSAFPSEQMVSMAEIEALAEEKNCDSLLLPMANAVSHFPAVTVPADSLHYIQQGHPVLVPNAPTSGLVRILDAQAALVGIGEIQDDGRVGPKRLMANTPTR